MKYCPGCSLTLPKSCFGKRSDRPCGIQSKCKDCRAAYGRKNNDRKRENARRLAQENPEKIQQKRREKYLRNKEDYLKKCAEWRKRNLAKCAGYTAKYRASRRRAAPPWLTEAHWDEIAQIYESCPADYHVDHIVPLRGKTVCGLHVPWNLRHLPAELNLSKSNRLVA